MMETSGCVRGAWKKNRRRWVSNYTHEEIFMAGRKVRHVAHLRQGDELVCDILSQTLRLPKTQHNVELGKQTKCHVA
jgi:hypothetical protein